MVEVDAKAGCPGRLQDFSHSRRNLASSVASLIIHEAATCPNPLSIASSTAMKTYKERMRIKPECTGQGAFPLELSPHTCCLSCSSLFPFLVADWSMLSSVARMGVHTCRHELSQISLGASQQVVAHNILHAVAQFHKALLPL